MRRLTILLISICAISTSAQDKIDKDREAIKKMCGCFEVTFNFAETFSYSKDSLYKPSETKTDRSLEWAQLVVDENDKIVIQHILQVGNPSEPIIIKHWRQDWEFQNQDFYMYNGDNNWLYEHKNSKEVEGQWTQKVFQVDDSPRYEGSGTWVHVDGKSYWENKTDAPLPRREYTKRSDYNITVRGNRHEVTDYGWVHDQDNDKILRTTGVEDVLIAREKGYNTYEIVADNRCKAAADWWQDNQEKWANVRSKWDQIFARKTDLSLEQKVDNKVLYKHLFSDEFQRLEEISMIIDSFVK